LVRFFVLVAAAATIGAGSVVAIKTIFPQQSASVAAAARSLGAEARRFRLSSLNPIRSAYDEVKAKITSPDPNPLGFSSTPLIVRGEPIKLGKPLDLGAMGAGGSFQSRRGDATWRPSSR
jgi:hypothetical protein